MSAKIPAHVYVDEMDIIDGPGIYIMAGIVMRYWPTERVEMTFRTAASTSSFTRKVVLTKTRRIAQEFTILEDGSGEFVDRYRIEGRIGDWQFEGTYVPRFKKGKITER